MDVLQSILFGSSFLTFGIGDGVTAADLIKNKGEYSESNLIGRYMYSKFGSNGVIYMKTTFTSIVLSILYMASFSDLYWTVNGILIALTIGGTMAMKANTSALDGKPFSSSKSILTTYGLITIILAVIGIIMDYVL